MKYYRRILQYVRPYKGVFACAILGMLVVASTDVMLLKIVQPLLNNVGAIDAESVWWLPYSIVGVFVLRGLGSYVSEFGLAWIGSRVVYDLRCEACDHLLRLPTSFYDATSAGFLLSRITFDAQQIAATASEAITVSTRQYAKRQETWFRHQLPTDTLVLDAVEEPAVIARRIAEAWPGGGATT